MDADENGLEVAKVKEKQRKYGKNELPEEETFSVLKMFLLQFKNPLVYILTIAAAISLALKEFIDMGIIFAAVLINAGIGFIQEYKAEKTFLHLKKMVTHPARTLRKENGIKQEQNIDSRELVPGDIIILEAGDIVPADARLIETYNLETVESILTGESIPSNKTIDVLNQGTSLADRKNMIYSGTTVARGKAKAVVIATGMETEMGKIAGLIKNSKDNQTPLQKKINRLAIIIGSVIGFLCLGLFIAGLIMGQSFLEMLLISVAVAVAGVPEGLAIAVTVCLAVGMQRILKNKALTKKLVAAETLGSTTVICSDKTGTLTEGKMNIAQITPYNGIEGQEILKAGLLCNNAILENEEKGLEKWEILGDTTEIALFQGAIQSGLNRKEILNTYPRLDEIPFESETMFMGTLHQTPKKDENILLVKGAPEKILELTKLSMEEKKKIKKEFEKLTAKGLRILGFAKKNSNKNTIKECLREMEFLGLIALKDPLRPETKKTIEECRQAGIRPIILTGDHPLTAKSIGLEIGLIDDKDEIFQGKDLDKFSDKELGEKIKKTNVFARVEPKQKIRIVDILQRQGEVVTMTGDGVNDAPAIKSADIGVALGSGSEVTKETADVVLLDDNFKTIVEIIKTGRNIFDNIKKVILFLFSGTFTEFILVGGPLLLGFPLPILASQILWINIIEDTLPAMALAYEKEKEEVLKEKPRGHRQEILDKEMKFLIFVIGIITDLILLFLFVYLYKIGLELTHIRTIVFAGLGIDTLFYVFSCKDLKRSIWKQNPFDNFFLNVSVIIGWLMLLAAVYAPFFQKILQLTPLNWNDWLLLISLGLIEVILLEIGKIIFIHKKKK